MAYLRVFDPGPEEPEVMVSQATVEVADHWQEKGAVTEMELVELPETTVREEGEREVRQEEPA